ncbi:glutamate racemase [Ichthyenterobacterium sp. W332]|uniref:Glutamate racemase n=1 Tax=Microcosmobacter mediterraneus TaxID=3075607 RepID=A0ABU2YMI7_9FLAO|nr:glutamate racemase [Ichthyenterobacterium sp. W332]MDT0558899.1 glutamate racemase [Ichthyenterobacterium sp. W332]
MSNLPIGIFDSGVGGTSIWKEIHKLLPNENTIYLADSLNAPYGPKGKDRIIELCKKNTELLISLSCKLIVVACNTATTNAIDYLRSHYNVPFIGIEPAIKPAALKTKTKTIGILATKGTLSSELFHKTSDLYSNSITVIEQIGEGIVPLVESGKVNSSEMQSLLQKYMEPMLKAEIDYLVLGCTHYPYLIPILKDILPREVTIIDSGEAVARQTKAVLHDHNSYTKNNTIGKLIFYSNGNTEVLNDLIDVEATVEYLNF